MIDISRVMGWKRAIAIATLVVGLGASADAGLPRLVVTNDGPDLGETPVVTRLEPTLHPGLEGLYDLIGPDGQTIRAEVWLAPPTTGITHIGIIFPKVARGRTIYQLVDRSRDSAKIQPAVELQSKKDGNIDILLRGKPFTTYRFDTGPKPILWPLIGPTGAPYTRSFPMASVPGEDVDHPHQRSFWFTYGQVNGVDFWAEQEGHGSIRERNPRNPYAGHLVGFVETPNDWLAPDGKRLLSDSRKLLVYATETARILDYDVTLTATDGPVTFGDTKEGMFGVRVATSMDVKKGQPGGRIVNAEGLLDGATWGKRSAWVDYSGPVDGRTVGIAILDHPENFGHPTPWHVREYGLFAANPFGRHEFGLSTKPEPTVLDAGKSLRFRYRVILHAGDATAFPVGRAYEAFARPPRAVIEGE